PAPATMHAAIDAALAAWGVHPLAPGEPASLADLDAIARHRQLEHLALSGNTGILRLLDLPAILELRVPDADRVRYAPPVQLGQTSVLVLDGEATRVDAGFVDRHWFGPAHVFWRDFDALGRNALGTPAHGPQVARLQALLRRTAGYTGPESGQYGPPTQAA